MKFIFSIALLFLSGHLIACDENLKSFKTDCDLQDRYTKVREIFREHNSDVTDIAEYRALRFIDRYSWEANVQGKRLPINLIYNPAPHTWNVWNEGLKSIFTSDDSKNNLDKQLSSDNFLSNNNLSHFNTILLSNKEISIKDPISGPLLPGKMRDSSSQLVGFCSTEDVNAIYEKIKKSNESIKAFEEAWEKKAQISIRQAIKKMGGDKSSKATLQIPMAAMPDSCPKGKGHYVYYTFPANIGKSLEWLRLFLKYNLEQYQNNSPIISPIELAAVIQKWFVSVHPFSDGNGRTSRIVQDLILSNFDLPFAPAGDLQDDSLEETASYVKNNYQAQERMVIFLESCADGLEKGQEKNQDLSYRCMSATEINK